MGWYYAVKVGFSGKGMEILSNKDTIRSCEGAVSDTGIVFISDTAGVKAPAALCQRTESRLNSSSLTDIQ
jgi:hypothetical protein